MLALFHLVNNMLRDRRVLIEAEIFKLKQECGEEYLNMVTSPQRWSPYNQEQYDAKLTKLTNLQTEFSVITHMINNGAK